MSGASYEVIVIGGGPAGAAVSRLLAVWGHRVLLITKDGDVARGSAESLPPSIRRTMSAVGVLDDVLAAGFAPNLGNTVFWGSSERRDEGFDMPPHAAGFLVFRPHLDAVLRRSTAAAGVEVRRGHAVTDLQFSAEGVSVESVAGAARRRDTATFVVDASGRAGVVARRQGRRYEDGHRMQAYLGVWDTDVPWPAEQLNRTCIETYEDGWGWSVPTSPTVRHVTAMVDAAVTRVSRGSRLTDAYVGEIRKTKQLCRMIDGARLRHVWACDASLYQATRYADDRHLLAGDSGAFIDPLSSAGVKKALASGWLAAVAVHTALIDAARRDVAFAFFDQREREIYLTQLRQAREHAREAFARHPHGFWKTRAAARDEAAPAEDDPRRHRDVLRAFDQLRRREHIALQHASADAVVTQAIVRDREIVREDALALRVTGGTQRYFHDVDLLHVTALAPLTHTVPDLFAAYCRAVGTVPLPNFLSALSLLIANGVLVDRSA